jgi:mannose-6-phosphate isomerase-like protein (cupin superfamily)
MNKIPKIKKPWGYELWIEDGTQTPYAVKNIMFLAGNRTSLQVHKYKCETNCIIGGTGELYHSNEVFDIDMFLEKGMSSKEVAEYEKTFEVVELYPGITFTITPGIVHRVVATTDLEFIETSTTELDDVYRLQDDTGRTHGKITSEHE